MNIYNKTYTIIEIVTGFTTASNFKSTASLHNKLLLIVMVLTTV